MNHEKLHDWSEGLLNIKAKTKELNHALLMKQKSRSIEILIEMDAAVQQLLFSLEGEGEKNPPDGGKVPRPQT